MTEQIEKTLVEFYDFNKLFNDDKSSFWFSRDFKEHKLLKELHVIIEEFNNEISIFVYCDALDLFSEEIDAGIIKVKYSEQELLKIIEFCKNK